MCHRPPTKARNLLLNADRHSIIKRKWNRRNRESRSFWTPGLKMIIVDLKRRRFASFLYEVPSICLSLHLDFATRLQLTLKIYHHVISISKCNYMYTVNILYHPNFFVQVIFGDSNWAPSCHFPGRKNEVGWMSRWDLAGNELFKTVKALQVVSLLVEIRVLALCRRTFNFCKFRSYGIKHWFIMKIC